MNRQSRRLRLKRLSVRCARTHRPRQLQLLRVLGIGGRRLRFVGAALRAAFVVIVPIGIVWIPFSRKNKSLQDVFLGTRVVYDWEPRPVRVKPTPTTPASS